MLPRLRAKLLFILLFALCAYSALAQQTPYSIFYRSNWQFINPAAIDRSHYLSRSHNEMVLNAGFRQQWIGLEGAPIFYYLSAEYCPELSDRNMPGNKYGVTAFGDKTDAIGTYGLYGNYSRFIPIPYTSGHTLHIGLSAGVLLYQVDQDNIRLQNQLDPILAQQGGQTYVDFAVGAMYRIRKEFYVGLSIPQTFTLDFQNRDAASGVFATERVRHIYLNIGGFIQRGEYDYANSLPDQGTLVLEPSCWIRYVPGVSYSTFINNFPFSIDANLRAYFRQKFWVGGGYGTTGLLNAEFGISRTTENETKWQVGISYGVPVGKKYLSLGHSAEIGLAYYFY